MPHCGCDINNAIRKNFPSAPLTWKDVDYVFESLFFEKNKQRIVPEGNGVSVRFKIKLDDGNVVFITQTKNEARRLAREICRESAIRKSN